MIPLAVLCVALYYMIFDLFFELRGRAFLRLEENEWAHWIDRPEDAQGEIASVIHYTQDHAPSLDEIRQRFAEVAATYLPPVERRIRLVGIMTGAAPLLGLLGTVTGMLTTFAGISGGGGGKATMDLVAGGISEALITTQTGLLIAIPAYVLLSRIRRLQHRLALFLRRVENLTLKRFARQLHPTPLPAATPMPIGAVA